MLRLVHNHLKTNKMCKNAVEKLPIILKYILDKYKTQQLCDKAILENAGRMDSIRDCYKIKKCVIKLLIIILMH